MTGGIVAVYMLLAQVWVSSAQERCQTDLPDIVHVKENDVVGTQLFNVSSPGETSWWLTIEDPQQKSLLSYFRFSRDGDVYVLRLVKQLDVEEIFRTMGLKLSVILLTLGCQTTRLPSTRFVQAVLVTAVNEFSPHFNTSEIRMAVKETAPVGKTLLSLITWSRDDDVNFSVREIEGFSLTFSGAPGQVNNSEKFLQLTNVYNGDIALKVGLDFEAFPAGHKFLTAGVVVKDTSGLTGEATLRLDVLDDDDLPPLFYYPDCEEPCSPLYQASISPNHIGEIESITPGPIAAKEGDSLNYTVTFSLVDGPPNFEKCLTINSTTGQMSITQALGQFYTQKEILVVVQATETSPLQHHTRTTLLLVVGDDHPTSGLTTLILLPITLVLLLLAVVCGLYWWMKNKRPFLHQIVPAIMTNAESTDQCISTVSEYSYIDTISVHDRRKQVSCSKLVEDWPAESSTQQTLHVMDHYSSNESSRPRPSGLDIYDQLETTGSRDGSWSRQTSPTPSKFKLTVDPPPPSSSRSSPYSPLRDDDDDDEAPCSSDSNRVQHNNRHAHLPLPVPLAVQEQRLSSIDFRLHHDTRDGPDRRGSPRGEAVRGGDYAPDVYDATADYQELEVDAGFYTDVVKLKRPRHVTEIPLDSLEPRYWTTVESLDSAESDI